MQDNGFKLYLTGINHKSSTVEEREKFQVGRKEFPEYLQFLMDHPDVEGVILVATCNRIEFYFVAKKEIYPSSIVNKLFLKKRDLNSNYYQHIFYSFDGIEVNKHLYRVISGLDSLVLGEYQIQGQIKEAYSIACNTKTVDKVMHKLFHAAFRAGKKVRSKTKIAEGKQSVSAIASTIVKENSKADDVIAIIGVNENTKILVQKLNQVGYSNFIFVNRTIYKAEMMAQQWGGKAMSLDYIEMALSQSKVAFSSTGASGYIVSKEILSRLIRQERCPEFIIDMAVPRDFDTSRIIDEFSYYDINDLQSYLDEEVQRKIELIPAAENIIDEEVQIFEAWTESQSQNGNLLEPYYEKLETIRLNILDEHRGQFSNLVYDKVDKLTKQMLHRLQSTFVRAMVNEEKNRRTEIFESAQQAQTDFTEGNITPESADELINRLRSTK